MKNRFFSLAALIAAVICASFICTDLCGAEKVKYVFVLIGDGFGPNQRAVGEAANGKKLAMNTLPVATFTGTNNVQGWTTDSAASGTAISCGVKTYNGAIGMDKDKKPLVSLAKNLKKKGPAGPLAAVCCWTPAMAAGADGSRPNDPNSLPTLKPTCHLASSELNSMGIIQVR